MKSIPVEKNKDYNIYISGYGSQGEGVGKIDDFTVFVPGALDGEKVTAKIVKVAQSYAFGKLAEVLASSASRTAEKCKIYKRCGGCNLQHLSYEEQLNFKKKRVIDCISRIGKISDSSGAAVLVHDTIGMKNPYRYRNKVQLPVGQKDGKAIIGFYAQRSHDIIDMEECIIQDETGDIAAAVTKDWINDFGVRDIVRHIMVRKAFRTGEVMVVIVTKGSDLPYRQQFISRILEHVKGVKSIIQNINAADTNVILGEKCVTLWGQPYITDFIGNFKFRISPLSFFQVNPVQMEVLYNKALEYADLKGDEVVFDAYCGTGTISLFLSQKAKKVYGVEIIPAAIADANNNAEENNINNTEFIVGESEKVIPELINKGIKADVVVVDPPRKGCGEALIEAISEMKPAKVVYISCDPGTLARDLGIFYRSGYFTKEIQPVDMFPQTSHVECVAKLERITD